MKKRNLLVGLIIIVILAIASTVAFFIFNNISRSTASGTFSVGDTSFTELSKGDLPEDWDRYTQAKDLLAQDPQDRASILNMGYMYRKAGKYEDALKWFNLLVAKEDYEVDSDARYGLARVYTDQRLYESSEDEYYRILKDYPLNIRMYEELLMLYSEGALDRNQDLISQVVKARAFDTEGQYKEDLDRIVTLYNAINE